MSLPLRAVGNVARANPRHYSTHTESAFTHRKAPPMPSFDHLLHPGQVVSFLGNRLHSLLGSAFMPYLMPEVAAAPAPRPVLVATEIPTTFEAALMLINEEQKRWSWNEAKEEHPMTLWSLPEMKLPEAFRPALTNSAAPSTFTLRVDELSLMYAAADVALVKGENYSVSNPEPASLASQEQMIYMQQHAPRLSLLAIPAEHRTIDGYSHLENLSVEVPVHTPSDDLQTFMIAAAAATTVAATVSAAITALIRGAW